MRIKVGLNGKRILVEARELSEFGMFKGLMFKARESENLLFDRGGRWAIHSFFVFFPFLALWLDKRNNVLEHRIVRPFSFHIKPKKRFAKLIELPLDEKNNKITGLFLK